MQETYRAAQAVESGMLAVGGGHRLHYELSGAGDGIPVLCLHGGPGSGCGPRLRSLYDGTRHRIVCFDQRGAGRSEPQGETRDNRTPDLVADIERLRVHLGVDRWLVSGGSWGAALAVAYAAAHPQAVGALLLRSVFLTGDADLDWFFGEAAAAVAPREWAALRRCWDAPLQGRDVPAALARALDDAGRAGEVAQAWRCYEAALCLPGAPPPAPPADAAGRAALVAKYRLQAAYLSRRCDLGEEALLAAAGTLRGLPCVVLHGTADRVCRPLNAARLAAAIDGARLQWIEGAGHDPFDAAMQAAFTGWQRRFHPDGGFGS
ncbi:alpha/beta fold hydrolase [Caldimonas tepidiphila]|uniref:alpha/beta fold hydrolase n=1 Tax=Caldimonas tepidiphila TaxID=2315841 RepID=UPI000E5B18C9|nr:alpha/beta fold hydrolase [Caldimonas tepidiphila]